MIKLFSAMLLAVMFIACSETGEKTGETFHKTIECNEFGIAYYNQNVKGYPVYSPVLIEKINDKNETSIVPISCKQYNEIKKESKDNKLFQQLK